MRGQIARLERELADAFVTAYPMGGLGRCGGSRARDARMLTLGELERVRDELAERLACRPGHDRGAGGGPGCPPSGPGADAAGSRPGTASQRISCQDLGEPGCGVWQVRPRLGLIGMLMGWWQVKLSSGCPLPRAAVSAAAR